jgi:hypothetical protein
MSVLITAAADSAAFRLARILNKEDVFFASDKDMPVMYEKRFLKIPSADSPSFIHEVLKICLDYQIKEIYPLMRNEIIELSASRQLFEEFGIILVIPSIKWIETRLNDLPFRLSNIIVMINGKVCSGESPIDDILPKDEENGVFQWNFTNDQLIFYSLFVQNA